MSREQPAAWTNERERAFRVMEADAREGYYTAMELND